MKNILLLSLALSTGIGFSQETVSFKKCYAPDYIEYQEQKTPGFKQDLVEQFEIAKNSHLPKSNTPYVIPVVVHIVYNTSAQNLHDSIVHNQIKTLNEDFQRRNADTVNMRSDFEIVAGGLDIEFRLAAQDPEGNPTSGITRTSTNTASFADFGIITGNLSAMEKVKSTSDGGINPWDQSRYMNIWVCNMELMGTTALLGYATPPVNLPNWPTGSTGGLNDGVVIQFQAFGSNNPNNLLLGGATHEVLGRTTTHEVGHYLGLRHIWGDGDCTQQDGIDDTPNSTEESSGCPNANKCVDLIGGIDLPDMVENFMDYSDETCQNSFTKGQIDLITGVLENQRYDLVYNNSAAVGKESFTAAIFPNPTENELNIQMNNGVVENVEVYNTFGQIMQSSSLSNSTVQLDVSHLDKGVYLVKITDDSGSTMVKKFVKK